LKAVGREFAPAGESLSLSRQRK